MLLAAEKCWESCVAMILTSKSCNKNMVCHNGDSALAIATKSDKASKGTIEKLLQAKVKIITLNKVRVRLSKSAQQASTS